MNELETQRWRIERLKAAIDKAAEGNASEFGRMLGYKDGAFIRQLLSGARPVREKTITAVQSLPGLGNWFASGLGGSFPNFPFTEPFDQNVENTQIEQRPIPVLSYVQAGRMAMPYQAFSPNDVFEVLMTGLDLSERAFGLIVRGDSMAPDFIEGDRILVDPNVRAQPGDFVVAKNGSEEATFKKYRPRGVNIMGDEVFELSPLNDDYPTLRSDVEPLAIIGVMVEHRRYRRR